MSAGGHDAGREIARGLSQILNQALAPGAPRRTLEAARDLAQVLSLRGLDRLLGVLAAQPERPWPPALRPAIDRLLGAAAECARDGSVAAFRRADDEMSLTAQAIESIAQPRTSPGAPGPKAAGPASLADLGVRATPVPLAEVLSGLKVQGDGAVLQQTRLLPLVAAALRAALDWLTDEGSGRRPMAIEFDGSALDVTCDGVAFSGIQPAGEVLAGVGAHLGPGGDRPGSWTVRVPVFAERETFLMIEQDELCLAVPWHAVTRVRLAPVDAIDEMAHRQGLQVLPPLARDARRAAEQPVVVVALGRKRACLVADRLVWRMAADPATAQEPPPAAGITRAVRGDDDEIYWVLEAAWLLRDITPPALPDSPRRGSGTSGRSVESGATQGTAPAVPPRSQEPPPPIPFPGLARGPMRELSAEDVEAIETDPEAVEGPESSTGSEPESHAPEPVSSASEPETPPVPETATAPPRTAARRALVVEDSITARVFLTRLLEQQGFHVQVLTRARELPQALAQGPWTIVFIDVELPDAQGAQLLAEVGREIGGSTGIVALVRDVEDEATARAAGVQWSLRKPFERDALERVLSQLVPPAPPPVPDIGGWGGRV